MNSIALFYLPNLTTEQKAELLNSSGVGSAVFVESITPELVKYNRLRNIDLTVLQSMGLNEWTFPAHVENEDLPSYNARVKTETIVAFNQLQTGVYDVVWVLESGFQNLAKQPEFQESNP